MKNSTLIAASFAAAALALLSSCAKQIPDGQDAATAPCTLTLTLDGIVTAQETKVIGQNIGSESTISDVQILVFNSETGKLDAAKRVAGLSAVTNYSLTESLECTQGSREIWALVNAPVNYIDGSAADMVTRLTDLKSRTSALTDNTASHLVMAGSAAVTLNAATQNVSVTVSRICAAVVLGTVSNEMYLPAYQQSGKVKITGAYLMNVPNQQKYDLSVSAKTLAQTSWISANTKTSEDAQKLLTQDTYNEVVAYNGTLSKVSTFYAYPNDADPSEAAVWSQRATTLIVEAEIDGQSCVYPVQLGQLAANTKYTVTLKLHRMGADPTKPWEQIKFDAVTPLVTVADWTTGAPVNTEI